MFIMSFIATACGGSQSNAGNAQEENLNDRVEILYFHGKQRCATCMAIETNTKEVIESQFADEVKNGTVVLRIIDISRKENEEIADKYEVTWSSLFVCKWKDGKEKYENLTELAFANARTAPGTFRTELAGKITDMLK